MKIFSVFIVFLSFQSFAQNSTKEQIKNLSNSIYMEADLTTASLGAQNEAINLLRKAYDLISNSSNSNNNQECVDFAYQKYYISQSSSAALDNAILLCKKVYDNDLLQQFYNWFYLSQSSTSAIESAARYTGYDQAGKLDEAKFIYSKYYLAQSSTESANRTGTVLSQVKLHSVACLQKYFDIYYKTMSATAAMDKTIPACGN